MKISFYKYFFIAFLTLIATSCSYQQEHQYHIGFSQCTMGDSWRENMLDGMKRELSFFPEILFEMKDANGSTKTQNQQIQAFIDRKIDLLIVSPNENQANTAIIEKAFDAGIPVIILDRRTTSNKYTAFVGAENYLVGQNAGDFANILLKGVGNVLEIGASPNTSPSIDRHSGLVNALKKYPKLNFLETIWTEGNFTDSLKTYLNQHAAVNLIFAHNDRLALIIHQVCKELGLLKKIRIIGVDGLAGENEGLDMVKKGMIDATILYPTGGEETIQTAMKILKKQAFNKENQLFSTVISHDNVNIMLSQFQKIKVQQGDIERQALKITDLNNTYSSQRNRLYFISALLTAVVILGAVLYFLLQEKQRSNRILEEQNVAILEQKNEIEKVSLLARKATEDKMRFYSYISHEFKTPLSLILTPTEDLLQRKKY